MNGLKRNFMIGSCVLLLIIGVFYTNFNIFSKDIEKSRNETDRVLSLMNEGLSTHNGNLVVDKSMGEQRHFLIGNREVLIIIDENKELSDSEYYKDVLFSQRDDSGGFIIYLTKDRIFSYTKLGWKDYSYASLETSKGTNLLDGSDILGLSNINSYIFESVPLLIIDALLLFWKSILQVFCLTALTYLLLDFNRTMNNSNKMLY